MSFPYNMSSQLLKIIHRRIITSLRTVHQNHATFRPVQCPKNSHHLKPPFSCFHTKSKLLIKLVDKEIEPSPKELVAREHFFVSQKVKTKEAFLQILDNAYKDTDKIRRGHIELLYAALKYMQDYGVEGDIDVYKKLMDVFPKGRMIPKNMIQAEFYHFPRHQECAIIILDRMEHEAVCPDNEMKEIVFASFGFSSHVYKKLARMMYWMPKLKNINPYLPPDPLPIDARDLAILALKKMCVDRRTKITEFNADKFDDSIDKTWIMSAQSPTQRQLIGEHSEEKSLYIEGPFLIWIRTISISYFVLKADPKIYPKVEYDEDDLSNLSLHMFGEPKPTELALCPQSVHEQVDGIIMALCCTGTSSKDSLLSWIRFLKKQNPKLDIIPVLLKIRTSPSSLVAVNANKEEETSSECLETK